MKSKVEAVDAARTPTEQESYYIASQWKLMRRKFLRHRLSLIGAAILLLLYLGALLCQFIAPTDPLQRYQQSIYSPPNKIHLIDSSRKIHLRPFVYGLTQKLDMTNLTRIYTEDRSKRYPIYFFVHGAEYRLWGLFRTDIHLFGVREGMIFLFGTDSMGRDLFTRNLYASRISLTVGLVGVALSFILGCIIGGVSGYFGGTVDMVIQRAIEILLSIPTIPLWAGLAAALPADWPPVKVYFAVTMILAIIGWSGLARVVRGRLLELREEDFVAAAHIAGASSFSIIRRHLLPSFLSYLIVNLTLAIPGMILGETALSFLGIGMRPPAVSWGTLLQDAQNILTLARHPWLLIPAIYVIVAVLAFNFVGDGLRDAADPYK